MRCPRALAYSACMLSAIPLGVAAAQAVTRAPTVDSSIVRRLEALAAPPYRASWRTGENIHPGLERIAVLISSRDCIGGRDPRFKPGLQAALRLLAEQARRDGAGFSATGVAIDWEPDSGAVYLGRLADFDQWVVGRNWANDAVVRLVWQDSGAVPGVPQLIVFEREIHSEAPTPARRGGGLGFSSPRVMHRFVSAYEIATWVLATADSTKVP